MQEIIQLYRELTGNTPDRVEEIPGAVSTRRYFRIYKGPETLVGTYSPDTRETIAFLEFSEKFSSMGIRVPRVMTVSADRQYYLQTDLGDQRLHEMVAGRTSEALGEKLMGYYAAAIRELVQMQFQAHEKIDYSVCVPREAFDRQSVLWDLNHFKYYFLKPSGLPFDEQLLEDAFQQFADQFGRLETTYFMFRDFQTRNIMIHEDAAWLIDFQGGRKGPVQYDLASLVYESKAALTPEDRSGIIENYIQTAATYSHMDKDRFMDGFHLAALIRILQALGAYGLRGMVEKKAVFLQSIPAGLANLGEVLERLPGSAIDGYFRELLEQVAGLRDNFRTLPGHFEGLTVTVYSFSYRKPLPDDLTGNGGGFVYDCRFLANPGRCDELKMLDGFDEAVQRFLEKDPEVELFLESIKSQAGTAIKAYRENGYRNLMFSFGCTGGRHRSVYISHRFASWCRSREGVRTIEIHRELGREL